MRDYAHFAVNLQVMKHYLIECKNEIFAKGKVAGNYTFLSKYPIFSGLNQKQKAQFLLGCEEPHP